MIADYFSYDGISSETYNLIIGSFSGADNGTQDMGNVDITTIKAPHSNNFLRANATYNNPLVITFSIVKMNCEDWSDYIFSEREIAFISRWLARKDYKKLKFHQDGWEDIYYNAILKVNQHMFGGECVGFDITATCDAPWGYDQEQTTNINAISGMADVLIYDDSDEIGELFPRVDIDVIDDCVIEITNETTGKTTKIRNCVAGEKIRLNNCSIESSECIPDDTGNTYRYTGMHQTLFDDFNWKWPSIVNSFTPNNTRDSRVNHYVVNGNCKVKLVWSSPRKAVI